MYQKRKEYVELLEKEFDGHLISYITSDRRGFETQMESDLELLESVWQTYGDYTGNALEALSHKEKPWIEARNGYAPDERCNICISLKSMKDFFKTIYIGGEA
jgi:uncharacterized phage-associated protein